MSVYLISVIPEQIRSVYRQSSRQCLNGTQRLGCEGVTPACLDVTTLGIFEKEREYRKNLKILSFLRHLKTVGL